MCFYILNKGICSQGTIEFTVLIKTNSHEIICHGSFIKAEIKFREKSSNAVIVEGETLLPLIGVVGGC